MPDFDEYKEEIKDLWDTHWLTNMGKKHIQFQSQLRNYLGVKEVELLTNGHLALELTMQALGLTGEVITTPFTFASTTHAIVRNGLEPVFCDINPYHYTIDVEKIEPLITERTSAIVPVHVYGNICDIEAIEKLADKYNLKVIYDAAHSFGETYKGRGVGAFGDASCFSFHATKVFNTIEGGAVCFEDRELGKKIYDLKNFGIHGPETVTGIGANAKMNEFCAAMGICNLRHIDEEIAKREKVAERYLERLYGASLRLPEVQKNVRPNYGYFPVLFESQAKRDEVFEKLAKNGIFARKYFYPITSAFECYRGRFNPEDTPVALDVSQRVLTLPMFADLPLEGVDRICDIIIKYIIRRGYL